MPKLPEFITKKVGPLPIWSYVVIGGVLVFVLRKRGAGGSSAGPTDTISVPTLSPGSASSLSDGAMGSPNQNAQGGMDTQPAGAAPWWSTPPDWWGAGMGAGANPAISGGGGGNTGAQSNASAGVAPKVSAPILGPTAGELGAQPSGGWKLPPIFQWLNPTTVRDMSGGGPAVGQVNPSNRLLGYSDPKTGSLSPTPNGGPAIWA